MTEPSSSLDLRRTRLVRVGSSSMVFSRRLAPLVAMDLEGRVQYLIRPGVTWRRGLDGRILVRGKPADPSAVRVCSGPESEDLIREGLQAVEEVAEAALASKSDAVLRVDPEESEDRSKRRSAPSEAEGRERLRTWLRGRTLLTAEDHAADVVRFRSLHGPVPILPPDQYGAVLFQAVTGCPWNRCGFCKLYGDTEYSVRSRESFHSHVQEVIRYFRRGLNHRRSAFLGDASVSRLSGQELQERCSEVRESLKSAVPGRDWPVHAFADAFTPMHWSEADLKGARESGLVRLHVGVESGCARVLKAVKKPQTPDRVRQMIARLKEAGIGVGCIFLVGLGGRQLASAHLRESLALVESLPLDHRDLLYLSPLLATQAVQYDRQVELDPLTVGEVATQLRLFREQLAPIRKRRGFTVATYDLRLFAY